MTIIFTQIATAATVVTSTLTGVQTPKAANVKGGKDRAYRREMAMPFMTRLKVLASGLICAGALSVAAPEAASADSFSVLNYNAMLMSKAAFPNHRQDKRAELIPSAIKRRGEWDVIVFNEAFENDARAKLVSGARANGYPFITAVPDAANAADDGGVFIASRHPIMATDTLVYGACDGVFGDCLANKGAVYAKVLKNGKFHHVFGTHLQAENNKGAVEARLIQMTELFAFVVSKAATASLQGEPVIIAGDMNIDPVINKSEYKNMLGILAVEEPKLGSIGPSFDPVNNELAHYRYEGERAATLDYVMPSKFGAKPKSTRLSIVKPMVSKLKVVIPRHFGKGTQTKDLSDHYGVSAVFNF